LCTNESKKFRWYSAVCPGKSTHGTVHHTEGRNFVELRWEATVRSPQVIHMALLLVAYKRVWRRTVEHFHEARPYNRCNPAPYSRIKIQNFWNAFLSFTYIRWAVFGNLSSSASNMHFRSMTTRDVLYFVAVLLPQGFFESVSILSPDLVNHMPLCLELLE
jgi:hypothetical protein